MSIVTKIDRIPVLFPSCSGKCSCSKFRKNASFEVGLHAMEHGLIDMMQVDVSRGFKAYNDEDVASILQKKCEQVNWPAMQYTGVKRVA